MTMKKKKLSDRQRFILSFIKQYSQDHGYAPSIREIKGEVERVGLVRTASGNTSTSVIDYNLKALEEARSLVEPLRSAWVAIGAQVGAQADAQRLARAA